MTTTTTTSPLISATKLAERWGVHNSTIARRVEAGIIKPVLRSGKQSKFSLADVIRVEAGQMPRHRGLESLTVGQQAAMPGVLSLLGLGGAELSPYECEHLAGLFHSIPYPDREDGQIVAAHLELLQLGARAVSRAETMQTIADSPALIVMVKDLQATVNGLLPVSLRGGSTGL